MLATRREGVSYAPCDRRRLSARREPLSVDASTLLPVSSAICSLFPFVSSYFPTIHFPRASSPVSYPSAVDSFFFSFLVTSFLLWRCSVPAFCFGSVRFVLLERLLRFGFFFENSLGLKKSYGEIWNDWIFGENEGGK